MVIISIGLTCPGFNAPGLLQEHQTFHSKRRRRPACLLLGPAAPLCQGPGARDGCGPGGAPQAAQSGVRLGDHNSQAPARPARHNHVTARPKSQSRQLLDGLGTGSPERAGPCPADTQRAHHGGESGCRREKRARGRRLGPGPWSSSARHPEVSAAPAKGWRRGCVGSTANSENAVGELLEVGLEVALGFYLSLLLGVSPTERGVIGRPLCSS